MTVAPEALDVEAVRDEARAWLAEHWSDDVDRSTWLDLVIDRGYAVPTWPTEWFGLGLSADHGQAITAEFRRVGAPGAGQDVHNLWANTLLTFGTEQLKQRLLRPLLRSEVAMCLLYSEPGAGSDLAGLQTRADRDGDEYVVNGQKVWTSGGKTAEYGMLIARTDWDVPKHRGISFFFLPMDQAGIEVRPIRQITGESHFNEVFIDDARVPAENLLGGLGEGWRVLQTALAYERSVMGDVARGPRTSDDEEFGGTSGGGAEVDLAALARRYGKADDPVIRQELMRVHALRQVNKWNAARAKSQLEQGTSSPILSLGKLAMSRILHRGAHLQRMIIGPEAFLNGRAHPDGDAANFLSLNAYFTSIGGGTDQIQRNIIGERVLGLPKEPELDRDVPFRDVAKATVTR
jgi:alkylation response protein AidB-like acyl-CoA dehydrogenase